jgi:hypothetical protein
MVLVVVSIVNKAIQRANAKDCPLKTVMVSMKKRRGKEPKGKASHCRAPFCLGILFLPIRHLYQVQRTGGLCGGRWDRFFLYEMSERQEDCKCVNGIQIFQIAQPSK